MRFIDFIMSLLISESPEEKRLEMEWRVKLREIQDKMRK
jgi:hypothetical protein